MQELIQDIINILTIISNFSTDYVGINIFMVLPVYMIVTLIAGVGKIRERFPNHKTFILTAICLVSSFLLLALSQDFESLRQYFKSAILLGSVTSFGYSFFKGFYRLLIFKFVSKIKSHTGKDGDKFLE